MEQADLRTRSIIFMAVHAAQHTAAGRYETITRLSRVATALVDLALAARTAKPLQQCQEATKAVQPYYRNVVWRQRSSDLSEKPRMDMCVELSPSRYVFVLQDDLESGRD